MGDVYMVNGKILSGLPNHAKDIEIDNTGTTLSSTNTENAIKEVNSNLSNISNTVVDYRSAIPVLFPVTAGAWTNYQIPNDQLPTKTGYVLATMILAVSNSRAYGVTYEKNDHSIWALGRTNGDASVVAIPVFTR